jgi:hypothetical protein
MRAAGQIGTSQVYATWRGVPYVRQYVVPANPRTSAQMGVRSPFRWLQDAYRSIPGALAAVYEAYTEGRPLIGRNGWTRVNLSALAAQNDISNITYSPGARGGPAPGSMTVTPGSGSLTVDVTTPSLPTGWSIAAVHAVALEQQDPQSDFMGPWQYGSDNSAPYSVTLSGLRAATQYMVGTWIEYLRPDGSAAYSASLQVAESTL